MKFEKHLERLKESLEVIDESIEKGVVSRQRNIGFNVSAAAVDMIEMLFHKNELIDSGYIVKHEWFKSKNKIKEKLDFDFSKKKEILELMFSIEEKRNLLCYGSPQPEEETKAIIKKFNQLKELFIEAGLNEIR